MKKSDYLFWGLCLVVVVWFAGQRIARSRAAKAWEAERQERIAKDFNKSYDEVKAFVAQYIPDVTDEQMEAWSANNRLENLEIGGERRYFRKAGPNLFRIDKACESIQAEAETLSGNRIDGHNADDAAVIPVLVEQVRSQLVAGGGGIADTAAVAPPSPYLGTPKTFHVRYTLTVHPDAVPAGETVRCWLPFPASATCSSSPRASRIPSSPGRRTGTAPSIWKKRPSPASPPSSRKSSVTRPSANGTLSRPMR